MELGSTSDMAENMEMWDTRKQSHFADHIDNCNNLLLSDSIAKEISCMPSSSSYIYKVPNNLRILGTDIYEPHVVSIGPYHRGKKHLQDGEKYKSWYFRSFVSRTTLNTGQNICLMDLVEAITEVEVKAREYYAEPISLNSEEFVRMMIFDGCFILELLYRYHGFNCHMIKEDFIFCTAWIVPCLRMDLILLENQIPLFVLECLFDLCDFPQHDLSVKELALKFFSPIFPAVHVTPIDYSIGDKHLLDLMRNCILQQYEATGFEDSPIMAYTGSWKDFHPSHIINFEDNSKREHTTCATELEDAGVKFKEKTTAYSLLDITFSKGGEFEMPPFVFGEWWTVLFPNLIALEQCRRDYSDHISSYVFLVNRLINTFDDVKLLCDKRIIKQSFEKDGVYEKVTLVIGRLCEEIAVDNFYFRELCGQVNAFSGHPWNRWRAVIRHEFLKTPWTASAFVTGLILLVLTMVQTML